MRVIAGTARRLPLKTLPGLDTRPTTDRIKETLFNMLQADVPGVRFLDLFSGSGGIGIEALSRGSTEAVFVDNNRKACDVIKENLAFTKLSDRARVICGDAVGALTRLERERPFGIIFMDPPYGQGLEKRVLEYLGSQEHSFIDKDTIIIIEASLTEDFSYAGSYGFSVVKSKEYKTNKHVFLRKDDTV